MGLIVVYTYWKNKIQILNLFEDVEKTEEEDLKNQRISTLVFLILFFPLVSALLIYACLTSVTNTVVIQQPTTTVYKELQSKYPNTLVCPCQQILNEYRTFIVSFSPKFNQICSSDFISEQWLNYVNYRSLPKIQYHFKFDFRHSAYSFFQMLQTLCTLVAQTNNDQMIKFYSTALFTENLLSEETFLATILASKDQFLNTTASSFQTSLNSLRTILNGNNIINRLETNFRLQTIQYEDSWYSVTSSIVYPPDNCSCSVSSDCHATTGIFAVSREANSSYHSLYNIYGFITELYKPEPLFDVPGINVGCLILDGVLQSNLSCLYNASCLSQLNTYLNDSLHPFSATPLNVSYPLLPKVGNLVDKLMVDEWLFNSSYERYFSQCNPATCTYTYTKQFDILFIITIMLSTVGGIITLLMLVVLPVVVFTRRFVYHRRRLLAIQTETDIDHTESLRQQGQSLMSKVKDFVINLNFFKDSGKRSDHDLRNQRISTRSFIMLMIIILSIVVFFTSLNDVIQTVTIKQPTINVYMKLQTKYSQTLVCPCTQIAIDYDQFVSFDPTFHQICSSDFINKQWRKYVNFQGPGNIVTTDFRGLASSYFSTLLSFCNLSPEIINNALSVFNSTKYVAKNVQQKELFLSEAQQIVELFKQTTVNSYLQVLSVSRQIISGNALFSGLLTNYEYTAVDNNSLDQVFFPLIETIQDKISNSNSCSCKLDPDTCSFISGIFSTSASDRKLLFSIPGFWYGCYTIESLFGSTFECYFDQSCLDKIYQLTSSTSVYPFNATAMIYNSSNTQYNITTKIQKIVENLMIEQWNDQISFNSYYEQCNPVLCVYTYNKRGDFAYVFTITTGLIGGLTSLFKILIPPIVTFLRRKKRPQPIETEVNEHIRRPSFVRKYLEISKIYIITFNLYKNPNQRSAKQVYCQRISTRIFILLLIISLIVLFGYVSFQNITQTTTIKNPSIDQIKLLYERYPNGLQCPCQTISTKYQKFIQFNPRFHSICASDFVTSKTWLEIDYPRGKFDMSGRPSFRTKVDDFRQISSSLFQLLSSFCQLSLQTLNTELLAFNFTTFITLNLVSEEQFRAKISQIISQFVTNTAGSFINTFRLINNMTSANMLISALSSDSIVTAYPQYYYDLYNEYDHYDYHYDYVYDRRDQHYNSSVTGSTCDCQQNPYCIQQAMVYDLDATTVLFPIPGIYVGCYLGMALLQSDLRCFFDDLCLQQLKSSLNLSTNITSLFNSSSVYQVNTTLSEILSNLMIEQWNDQVFYQNYFNQCQPRECTITYVRHRSISYIVTAMTGLIGGLTKVYMFITPLLVTVVYSLVMRWKRKRLANNRVVSLITIERNTTIFI